MVFAISVPAFAAEPQSNYDLQTAYNNVMAYAADNGIDLNTTYEDFVSDYNGQPVQEYEQAFYQLLAPQRLATRSSGSSGGGNTYYYNTGYTCPSDATYSTYNLVDVV
jgi:hypothetical protein